LHWNDIDFADKLAKLERGEHKSPKHSFRLLGAAPWVWPFACGCTTKGTYSLTGSVCGNRTPEYVEVSQRLAPEDPPLMDLKRSVELVIPKLEFRPRKDAAGCG
jgi:hypothetical protein